MNKGKIEVICGSMFSGKTEELLRRLKRAKIGNKTYTLFKPSTDTRYSETQVVSHSGTDMEAIVVKRATEIPTHTQSDIIAVDEAQFFDAELIEICVRLASEGKRVIVAGLDMDYEGRPFPIIASLMAVAESITKLHAVCISCGEDASHSFRKVSSSETIMLGSKDEYEALCRTCFNKRMLLKEQIIW